MAKSESRYIQFYTPGSVACKVELRQEQEWAPLPQPKTVKRKIIAVDPVAVLGCVMAVCMLILMAVGIQHLNEARREVTVLEGYVAGLTAENQRLKQEYTEGYDLEVVRQKALDMGMIPVEDVPVTQIQIKTPQKNVTQAGALAKRWNAFTSTLGE